MGRCAPRPRVAGRGGRQGSARPAHREPLPLSAEQRPHEPHGGDGDAPAAGHPAHAVRPHHRAPSLFNFDSIAGIQGRALRGKSDSDAGYTLLDFWGDSVRVREKTLGAEPRTRFTIRMQGTTRKRWPSPPTRRPRFPTTRRMRSLCCRTAPQSTPGRPLQGPGVLRHDAGRAAGLRHPPQPRGVASRFPAGSTHHAPRGRRAGHRRHDHRRTARLRRPHGPRTVAHRHPDTDRRAGTRRRPRQRRGALHRAGQRHDGRKSGARRADSVALRLRPRPVAGAARAGGRKLVFGAWNGHLHCLDAATGKLGWKWTNGSKSLCPRATSFPGSPEDACSSTRPTAPSPVSTSPREASYGAAPTTRPAKHRA